MLLKAEKILSHDRFLIDKTEEELISIAKTELANKIVDMLFDKKLLKIEILYDRDVDFDDVARIRISTRAYNPDD